MIELRRQHRPAYQIAQSTGLSPATVSRILRRARLSRWRDLHPLPPPRHFADPFGSIGVGNPFPTPPASANVDWSTVGFFPWQITVTNHNQRTPYVYQYNLSVQHEVGKNLTAQVAYVGSSSKKLQTVTQGDPMILGDGQRRAGHGAAVGQDLPERPFKKQTPSKVC